MKIRKILLVNSFKLFALLFTLTFFACKDNGTNPPDNNSGSIKTGSGVDVGSLSVSSGGGKVTVSAPGKPVDGLTITVPVNSFSGSRTFTFSYAPVTSHTFGAYFKPVSPVVTISNGGGYADSIMLVKIPVTLATGEIPIAFFFNDVSGKLEPVPASAFDGSSVTIMTKHFDVSGIAAGIAHSRVSPSGLVSSYAKIVVSGLTDQMYNEIVGTKAQINTGYKPHVDDWEFINNGSYLAGARSGHCAGQNVSSLWYFFEKKSQTGKNLYHQFDQINDAPNKIWEDNPIGYHLASAVHSKLNWDAFALRIYEDYVSMQDDYTWKALVVSMLLTKEPYDIGIYGLYQGKTVGHDLTAYGVNIAAGKILIADPNYPGDLTREINYTNGHFSPYFSGLTAAQSDISFTSVKFTSKTAVIDWNTIGQTWTDVVDNKLNPGYPAYSLKVNDGAGYPLTDGLKTDLDTLDFNAIWNTVGRVAFTVYDGSGNRLAPPAGANFGLVLRDTVILKPGDNKLGIAVWGEAAGKFYFMDFQWITVTYQALRIDPQTMTGLPNTSYSWNAMTGTVPATARYEWDFGDQTAKVVKYNDVTASHTYTQTKDYSITLSLYDNAKNQLVGTASASANIGSATAIWDILHKQNAIVVEWQSSRRYSDGFTNTSEDWHIPESGDWLPITWNNTSLSGKFIKIQPYGIDTTIYTVTGTLAADGLTITSLTVSERTMTIVNSIDGSFMNSDERIIQYTISNIRGLDESVYNQPPYFQEAYDAVKPLISNPYSHYRRIEYDPNTKQTTTVDRDYVSTDWTGGGDNLVAVAFWVH